MTQRTTKTLLLTGTVIPALMFVALPRDAAAAETRERIQLAQQQQEPTEQKDRPAKRPEGAPGQRPPGGPPQGQPQQKGPPPAAQERREPPPGQPKAPAQAQQPPAPPAKGEPPAPPPAKQVQPPAPPAPPATKQVTPPTPPAQQTPPTKQAEPPAAKQPPAKQAEPPAPPAPPATKQVTPPTPPAGATPPAKQAQPPAAPPSPPAAKGPPPGAPPTQPAAGAPGQPPAAGAPGAPPAAGLPRPSQGQGAPSAAPGQQPPATATPAPPAGSPPAGGPTAGAPLPGTTGVPLAPQRPLPPPTTQSGAISPGPTNAQGQQLQRVDQIRNERRETREGDRTFIREPDRTIIREGGRTIIRHNEVDRFRFNARDVRSERQGSETITYVDRPDGTRIITVVDDDGRLLRRSRRGADGRDVIIIDNRYRAGPQQSYYVDLPPPVIRIPRERYILETERASQRDIYDVLIAPPVERIDRRYTLDEIRYSPRVRERMSRIDIDTINFESGSWAIAPDQVQRLAVIAQAVQQAIGQNPAEVFLVEGHTDAVGGDDDNLSLSDRRAESVAVALTQQFGVPAENLTTQGYGEQYLKVPSEGAERQNRRVTMRRITPLLTGQNGQGQN